MPSKKKEPITRLGEIILLARIFQQFRREIADSQTSLALERPLSEATSKQVVAVKRYRKRQERSAQTSEAAIATEI